MASSISGAALVTGGGRGLGRAIAERLAGDGFAVGVLARTAAELDETVESIRDAGGKAEAFAADVLDEPAFEKAARKFLAWTGGACDALVCAAGRLKAIGPSALVSLQEWKLDLDTALLGTQRAVQFFLPGLRRSRRGTIQILVGPGHNGELAHAGAYATAQAGLVRLVETIDRELQPDGPFVYAVHPGLVPTRLMRELLDGPDGRRYLPRFNDAFAEGKEVGPEVVAEMASWLVANRPQELRGRVVAAPATPAIVETRLARILAEDRDVLRLR